MMLQEKFHEWRRCFTYIDSKEGQPYFILLTYRTASDVPLKVSLSKQQRKEKSSSNTASLVSLQEPLPKVSLIGIA